MKIKEFRQKASEYVAVFQEEDYLYLCPDGSYDGGDFFLMLDPREKNLDMEFNDLFIDDVSFDYLVKTLELVKELKDTPIKERFPEKKYIVKVFPGNRGYLNIYKHSKTLGTSDINEFGDAKTLFTASEIDKLRQRDDIAIDWDKVKIEEVSEHD